MTASSNAMCRLRITQDTQLWCGFPHPSFLGIYIKTLMGLAVCKVILRGNILV